MRNLFCLCLLVLNIAFADEVPTYTTTAYREEHGLGARPTVEAMKILQSLPQHEFLARGIATPIPGKYDLTALVSPPENQGGCGSCWDFSLTKALRSALMLVGMDPGTLSFNYLLNNCGPGPRMYGCGGGFFDAGKSFLNAAGPWLEGLDPYTQREGRCKTGLSVAGTALEMVMVGTGTQPSFEALATVMSEKHMLAVDVAVCGSWGNYSSGIFNSNQCGASSINHMINMVGYNCETSVDASGNCAFVNGKPKNGDGYLIAMNNWGTNWGEGGYMRSRWAVDALANTVAYFRVKDPTPPPPPPPPPPGPLSFPWWLVLIIGILVGGAVVIVITRAIPKKL